VWHQLEEELASGRMTLREVLRREAEMMRMSHGEALAFLEKRARVDPAFAPFVRTARSRGASVAVVSSGLRQIIGPALERAGVDVPVFANDVVFHEDGWRMTFIDDSANGHDKAARVREARSCGARTVYVGDGLSDYEAALEADLRFAKKDRALERYCRERGVEAVTFASFVEIERTLFG
jgi:HAD superfamily phosphoserine phosphatase-like hydrolase